QVRRELFGLELSRIPRGDIAMSIPVPVGKWALAPARFRRVGAALTDYFPKRTDTPARGPYARYWSKLLMYCTRIPAYAEMESVINHRTKRSLVNPYANFQPSSRLTCVPAGSPLIFGGRLTLYTTLWSFRCSAPRSGEMLNGNTHLPSLVS